ncbi:unnamed protein product [Rotaria magnacalcarata]|uniref:Uncharacterized protein n=1 Tax=Rotaria magnacalcarata TaxID=392030 RepID=A0A815YLL0_9BILA|nr:unnamed protein product [Rotaria magnacalcarata]CAF4139745.1 unnamed protein product [Rotaria magnacalcarata]
MTDIPFQFSIVDINPTIVKQRKGPPLSNLFVNYRGSRPMSTNGTLPIITVPSFCNFKEKFLQMATNKKSTTAFNNPVESPTAQIKPRTASTTNRPIGLTKQKSSLSSSSVPNTRPITSHRSFTQSQTNSQLLYIVNTPKASYQPSPTRITNQHHNLSPPPPLPPPPLSPLT